MGPRGAPVVLVYTALCVIITIVFDADIDAQAGAYATGILAMMVSGAFAVTVSALRRRQRTLAVGFAVLTAVLLYALMANIIDKPDGITISAMFIVGIITISLISRISRTTELRADKIVFDEAARRFITDTLAHDNAINIIANRRQAGDGAEYADKEREQRATNPVPGLADILFLEIDVVDPSDFSETLTVRGVEIDGHRILRADAPAAPNAIATILLTLHEKTGVQPHCYFAWAEGSPLTHMFRYFLLGRGDTAPSPARSSANTSPTPPGAPASTSRVDTWQTARPWLSPPIGQRWLHRGAASATRGAERGQQLGSLLRLDESGHARQGRADGTSSEDASVAPSSAAVTASAVTAAVASAAVTAVRAPAVATAGFVVVAPLTEVGEPGAVPRFVGGDGLTPARRAPRGPEPCRARRVPESEGDGEDMRHDGIQRIRALILHRGQWQQHRPWLERRPARGRVSTATLRPSRSSRELSAFSRRSTQCCPGSRISTRLLDLRSFFFSASSAVTSPTVMRRPPDDSTP